MQDQNALGLFSSLHITLVGFAGTDPIKDDSGDRVSSSKRGSPYLRKTLFVVMTILLSSRVEVSDITPYNALEVNGTGEELSVLTHHVR